MARTPRTSIEKRTAFLIGLAWTIVASGSPPAASAEEPLRIFATTPDLASLAREVGGDRVVVTEMVRGPEDPHFAPARPSWIKELSKADLYLQNGLELEIGYAPLLLRSARNAKVLPGNPGFVDGSTVITPLQVQTGVIDRAMGDVHPFGNPHYLLDPLNGLKVARLIHAKLRELRAGQGAYFDQRYDDFRRRVGEGLVGAELAGKYDAEKLALLFEHGKLAAFLDGGGEGAKLGGWLGAMTPRRGAKVVDDHRMWPYFARRFGIEIVGDMEPKPGIPPTTGHLTALVELMKASGVKAVIAVPYYDPRHARFIAEATGAKVAPLSHQVGGRPEATDYLKTVDYNVRTLVEALGT